MSSVGSSPGSEPPDAAPAGRAGWVRPLRLLFSAAVMVALAIVLVDALRDLSSLSLDLRPAWLVLAWPIGLAAFPLLAVGWAQLLAAYGYPLKIPAVVRLWALAQASRYLPTGLAAVASRAVMAARLGVPRSLSVFTMAAEGGLLVAWASLSGGALVVSGRDAGVIPIAAAGLGGVLLFPAVLVLAGRRTIPAGSAWRPVRWLARLTEHVNAPRVRHLIAADLVSGANLVVKTAVYVLVAKAFLPVHGVDDTALLAGATNLAVVAGMIGVTPAGLGVREGVLIALLSHRYGAADAGAFAIVQRVWDLAIEIPWVATSALLNRRRGAPAEAA